MSFIRRTLLQRSLPSRHSAFIHIATDAASPAFYNMAFATKRERPRTPGTVFLWVAGKSARSVVFLDMHLLVLYHNNTNDYDFYSKERY